MMKHILIAVDFSKCSIHALGYAISIANKINADVLMVWVDNTQTDESVFPDAPGDSRKEVTNNFNELIRQYQPGFSGKLSFKIRRGKVHHEIANQAKYSDSQLIITGTHGVTGFEEFWIGSNAYRIVTYAPCPVITVRSSFNFRNGIERIVLPIDSSLESRQKLPFTTKLAKLFGSEIHVIGLYSTTIKAVRNKVDDYTKQVIRFLEQEKVPFYPEKIEADNITNATIDYAVKVDADIVSIMTEQETTTANLFLGAYAQQMVNHSPIPVLSVHAKEFIRIQSR